MIKIPSFLILALVLTSLMVSSKASTYPVKPIRIIAPEIGGASDLVARLVARDLSTQLNQNIIIDNRPAIAPELASKASPDGYTLLSYGSPLWISGLLFDKVAWNPLKSFHAITLASSSPNILVVNPNLVVNNVKELISLAKNNPGTLNFGSGTNGAITHLAGELFNLTAGIKTVRIAFKGNGPALNALIGGQVHIMFSNAGGIMPYIYAKRVRALAVTGDHSFSLTPELPTMIEAGLKDFKADVPTGFFAPAGISAKLSEQIGKNIINVLKNPNLKEVFMKMGIEVIASSSGEFTDYIKSDMQKWQQVIKKADIHN